jgi:hypothetical protein
MPHHFTTLELFDELAFHGIRAVRLWLTVPFDDGMRVTVDECGDESVNTRYEDMRPVWEHPDIDTIVLLLTDYRHTAWETDCNGSPAWTWLHDPVAEFATFMFENFGDQDKTIIIANTETDNQWRGFACTEPDEMIWDSTPPGWVDNCLAENTIEECVKHFSTLRLKYTMQLAEARHRAVQEARALYPDATLRIRTGMNISVFNYQDALGKYLGMYALNYIKHMTYQPDYIGVSHWANAYLDLAGSISMVMKLTAYPIERIYIDQIGQNERSHGRQYTTITDKTHEAWKAGVNMVMVWMWRTTWPVPPKKNKGMWYQLCPAPEPWCGWGDPTSGLGAIYELNEEAEEEL